jgi:hypothetical protein
MRKVLDNKSKALIAVAFAGWLTVLACTVDVKDHDGGNGKVDIQTPVGGMHIDEEANVKDTGLTVYPGARKKVKTDKDNTSANVNISSSFFGVKVVAIEYESDDPPGKVEAFYQDQLKKFGRVVECHTSSHVGDLSVKADHDGGKREVRCEGDNSGSIIELKVGTEENQHLVSVEPRGNGTDFALVYIQTRGKEGTI